MLRVFLFFFFFYSFSVLYAADGIIFKKGLGLYFDASFSPGCKNPMHMPDENVIDVSGVLTSNNYPELQFGLPHVNMNTQDGVFVPGVTIRGELSANAIDALQCIYFGLYEWNFDSRNIGGKFGPNADGEPFDSYDYLEEFYQYQYFESGDFNASIVYKENLDSFETNILNHLSIKDREYFYCTSLIGFRWIGYNNKIDTRSFLDVKRQLVKTFEPPPNSVKLLNKETYDIPGTLTLDNKNTFLGCQVGGILGYNINRFLYLDIPLKGGIYLNIIDYKVSLSYKNTGLSEVKDSIENHRDDQTYAVGYSAQMSPKIQIDAGYLYAYLGGTFFYLFGISPTYEQITSGADVYIVDRYGELSMSSINLGLGLHF